MKTLSCVLIVCFYFNFATAGAQEVSYKSLAGKWEYSSPNKKNNLTYDLGLDKNYICTTEHKEKEIVVKGNYQIDKINNIDRLNLNTTAEGVQTKTIASYYFIKFLGPDSLKVQMVSDKQDHWRDENRRNTMTFIRKKEKLKE